MKAAATSVGAASRGIRLPNYAKVRDVMDVELDEVWAGRKPAKQGLDDAVRLGDLAMKEGVTVVPNGSPAASGKKAAKKK